MIWTPKDGHYYGSLDGTWNHSWIHCSGQQVGPILRSSGLPIGKRIAVHDPSVMEKYLLEMISEFSGWRRPDERILRNIFENFARAVARQLFDPPGQIVPDNLLRVRSHLDQGYAQPQRLADLARLAGWSVPHLCTEFKRFFGASIVQYLLHLRMNQAAYFLRDHNRRIGEIAGLVGYPDLYTFSKMFKRHFGLSPRSWRFREP
jgi:AraC-like DNA-binding protein